MVSRLGSAVRTARLRLGWTRERLAHESGLSWAAITQIETGRRADARLSSLVALAETSGVSLDYLAGRSPSPPLLDHQAYTYTSDEELTQLATATVQDGPDATHRVLVVMTKPHLVRVKRSIGTGTDTVTFCDARDWYRTPAETTARYRDFVETARAEGAVWVEILAEPVWSGSSRAELTSWIRYESLLNLSLAAYPVTLTCLYDTRTSPRRMLADTARTHPVVATAAGRTASRDYLAPEKFLTA
jgi:transcriptional regulator with XRE-family HTH domain